MSTERVVIGNVEIVSVTDGMMPAHPSFLFSGVPPDMYEAALGNELNAEGALPNRYYVVATPAQCAGSADHHVRCL